MTNRQAYMEEVATDLRQALLSAIKNGIDPLRDPSVRKYSTLYGVVTQSGYRLTDEDLARYEHAKGIIKGLSQKFEGNN